MTTIGVNFKDDALAANCLDGLVAFPFAIQRMRDSGDSTDIPKRMIMHTKHAFEALDVAKLDCLLISSAATDHLYRHITNLEIIDGYTRKYTSTVVREFYSQLSAREVRTFYILDNSLRQDRFSAVMELLALAGVETFSPHTHGQSWESVSGAIR